MKFIRIILCLINEHNGSALEQEVSNSLIIEELDNKEDLELINSILGLDDISSSSSVSDDLSYIPCEDEYDTDHSNKILTVRQKKRKRSLALNQKEISCNNSYKDSGRDPFVSSGDHNESDVWIPNKNRGIAQRKEKDKIE